MICKQTLCGELYCTTRFTRNTSKPSKPPPSEQQQPWTDSEVAPSSIPKEKSTSQEPTTTHPTAALDAPAATAPTPERQPQKNVFTTALNTSHDAVLAELHGHPASHDLSARTEATPSTSCTLCCTTRTMMHQSEPLSHRAYHRAYHYPVNR